SPSAAPRSQSAARAGACARYISRRVSPRSMPSMPMSWCTGATSIPPCMHCSSGSARSADLVEIDVEDRHLEIVRPVPVLVIDVDQAQKLLAEIDLDAVFLLVSRPHVD